MWREWTVGGYWSVVWRCNICWPQIHFFLNDYVHLDHSSGSNMFRLDYYCGDKRRISWDINTCNIKFSQSLLMLFFICKILPSLNWLDGAICVFLHFFIAHICTNSCLCAEISCGPPLTLPLTNLLWDRSSTPGSVVMYECMDGFYQESGNNISSCSLSGEWGKVSVKCKGRVTVYAQYICTSNYSAVGASLYLSICMLLIHFCS